MENESPESFDLSHWHLSLSYTAREAAWLAIGCDPYTPAEDPWSEAKAAKIRTEIEAAGKRADLAIEGDTIFMSDDEKSDKNNLDASAVIERLSNAHRYLVSEELTRRCALRRYGTDLPECEDSHYSAAALALWFARNGYSPEFDFQAKATRETQAGAKTIKGNESTENGPSEKPLIQRERDSLLCMIAALANVANVDISKPSKTAQLIERQFEMMGAKAVAARTIEEHLKRAAAAIERRKDL